MEIVYAAHTESGTFMLDGTGVCRWAVAPPGKTHAKVPDRIVGSQYVATLDIEAPGALIPLPRPGCPMLFASTDETGHVTLVRTPPVLRFEDKRRASTPPPRCLDPNRTLEEMTPIHTRPSAPASTPPLPLVRPAASSLPPFRPVGMLPKLPPPPRPPAASIPPPAVNVGRPPTHSTMRPTPMAAPPPPRASIPPAVVTDRSFPESPDSSISARTNGIPSQGPKSVPVRIRSSNESLRRMARGR
jgi:hypothetical protein